MNTAIFLTLLVVISGDDKPTPTEQQGTWRAVALERDGQKTPDEVVKTITRTVEGERVVWKRDGKPFAATSLKLDEKADPKTIEVVPESAGQRDRLSKGIYKLEGDTLTLCMSDPGEPPPKKFEAAKGGKTTLMTFRREEEVKTPRR